MVYFIPTLAKGTSLKCSDTLLAAPITESVNFIKFTENAVMIDQQIEINFTTACIVVRSFSSFQLNAARVEPGGIYNE